MREEKLERGRKELRRHSPTRGGVAPRNECVSLGRAGREESLRQRRTFANKGRSRGRRVRGEGVKQPVKTFSSPSGPVSIGAPPPFMTAKVVQVSPRPSAYHFLPLLCMCICSCPSGGPADRSRRRTETDGRAGRSR